MSIQLQMVHLPLTLHLIVVICVLFLMHLTVSMYYEYFYTRLKLIWYTLLT